MSTFTVTVRTASATDTYSAIAAHVVDAIVDALLKHAGVECVVSARPLILA